MLTTSDLFLRLGAALLGGVVIGVNRDMHGKPVGVRTMGLVGLGSALVTMAGSGFSTDLTNANASRAIQGIITGIGFLGAGIIVKREGKGRVRGLTTAAAIWVTSAFGIVCGLGAYEPAAIALGLMIVLLATGGVIDRFVQRHFDRHHLGRAPKQGANPADPSNVKLD